jgi:DNA-binding response OmpR family regulator
MPIPRVLVVEDDPALGTLVETLLARRGFDCETITDGEAAIRRLRTASFDAILLDLMLPGAFGFDILRFLDAERPGMSKRVVVMTAASTVTLADFDTSRIAGLLRKPFDIQALVDHVEACSASAA